MRKTVLAGLLCLSTMLLSGCVMGNSVDNLLSPPEMSDDQREIYAALTRVTGGNIVMQYPKGGSYRSAVVMEDIDSDGINEGVAFYMSASEGKNNGSLRINILDNINGRWQSMCDFAGSGAAIDRVLISELGNSGRKNVIIGFTSSSGDKSFRSYVYSGDSLVNTCADSYASMFVTDLEKDGSNELSVIHSNNSFSGEDAYFSLFTDNGSEVFECSTVSLNDKTSEYVNIAVGKVGEDTPAVFIDGMAGNLVSTEIIYSINGVLRNPLYLSDSEKIRDTVRSAGYLSMDIDMDGIVEIPTLSYFPGYDQNSREPFLVTDWNVMESFDIVRKYSGYCDINNGYCFLLPSRWENIVTVRTDDETGDIVFLKYAGDITSSVEELMRIAAVPSAYKEQRIADGYNLMRLKDNMCYMYKVPSDTSEPLVLTESEIVNNFRIII